jgi:hypothetical protein
VIIKNANEVHITLKVLKILPGREKVPVRMVGGRCHSLSENSVWYCMC